VRLAATVTNAAPDSAATEWTSIVQTGAEASETTKCPDLTSAQRDLSAQRPGRQVQRRLPAGQLGGPAVCRRGDR